MGLEFFIPTGISLVSLGLAINATWRANQAGIKFEVKIESEGISKGRMDLVNTGSRRALNVQIVPKGLSQVHYTASHNDPKSLMPGDQLTVFAEPDDFDRIPSTLRVQFGRFGKGIRAVQVPPLPDGTSRPVSDH